MKVPLNLTKYSTAYEKARAENKHDSYDAIIAIYEKLGGLCTEGRDGQILDLKHPIELAPEPEKKKAAPKRKKTVGKKRKKK